MWFRVAVVALWLVILLGIIGFIFRDPIAKFFVPQKYEVTERADCSRIVKATVYEMGWLFGFLSMNKYENHLELEDGRHVVRNRSSIDQVGSLYCNFTVVRR